MTINENAPAIAKGEIEIEAKPELVWDVMTDMENWPSWNPDIKWVSLDGELTEGTKFQWKSGPGTIKSTILKVEKPRLLAWKGKTLGINAIHIWQLTPENGKTIVRTEESWEGIMVRIFKSTMQKTLEKAINAGLGYLRDESEKINKR